MSRDTLIYIAIMIVCTNLLRVLPMLLIRGRIHNRFFRGFLYYVPYVTLAVMTFPAIVQTTQNPLAGWLAFGCGIIAALRGWGMFPVVLLCCLIVFLTENLW